jgi:hypothetical protein
MLDETRHAQLAFSVASSFGGKATGPGPLPMQGNVLENDFERVVLNAVLEGCIGETVAALEAREAAQLACDQTLKALLATIADDEQRHAALAYEFVKWAVEKDPRLSPKIVAMVESELGTAMHPSRTAPQNHADDWMQAFGITSDARRAALRAGVLRQVVLPCVRALAGARRSETELAPPDRVRQSDAGTRIRHGGARPTRAGIGPSAAGRFPRAVHEQHSPSRVQTFTDPDPPSAQPTPVGMSTCSGSTLVSPRNRDAATRNVPGTSVTSSCSDADWSGDTSPRSPSSSPRACAVA